MPRTGSSLLSLMLSQHPYVKVYGELLHKIESERKESSYRKESGIIYYKGGNIDAIDFLKSYTKVHENNNTKVHKNNAIAILDKV